MRNLQRRLTRLEQVGQQTYLVDWLARNGTPVPTYGPRGDHRALLGALDDATLDRLIADMDAEGSPADRGRIAAMSDAELEAIAGGHRR